MISWIITHVLTALVFGGGGYYVHYKWGTTLAADLSKITGGKL